MVIGKHGGASFMRRSSSKSDGLGVDSQTQKSNLQSESDEAMGTLVCEGRGKRLMGMALSPTNTNIHFLRTCGLCMCRLAPARDIYMYKGDTAFCSMECREKHMKVEQRKEKMKAGSAKEHRAP